MRNGRKGGEREWSLGGSCVESTAHHSGQEVEDERRLWRNKEGMPDRKPRSMDMAVGGRCSWIFNYRMPHCIAPPAAGPSQGMCMRERVLTWDMEEELSGKLLYPEQCGGHSNTPCTVLWPGILGNCGLTIHSLLGSSDGWMRKS